MNEREALVALNAVAGLGTIRIQTLVRHFGSAQKVLRAGLGSLRAIKALPAAVARAIASFDADDFLQKEFRALKIHAARFMVLGDSDYPAHLKEIPDAPVVLYYTGTLAHTTAVAVSVVGSRRASFYGCSTAEKFGRELAQLGVTVVSGMARGIDAAAHRGALQAKGTTIAVLGSGLSRIYPPEHKKLFDEISATGAVVSEFPIATPPVAGNFPRRNRIISGLSLGTVVVEASKRSGALITADCALEQGRDVFAVPGKVDTPTAYGVNNLIKQGAKLISSVEDIIDELKLEVVMHAAQDNQPQQDANGVPRVLPNLNDDEARAYQQVSGDPVHIDELCQRLNITAPQAMAVLLRLELKKLVKQLPGKLFARMH